MSSNREELDNTVLLNFLSVLDEDLTRKITLVAVGGTAMTLLNAKASTLDVDFTIPNEDYDEFDRVLKLNQPGFRVDKYRGGLVFITDLPDDYIDRAIPIETNFQNIDLLALNPLDIVVTKIARLNGRDKEDITTCVKKYNLTVEQIRVRSKEIGYGGGDESYDTNLQVTLTTNFG